MRRFQHYIIDEEPYERQKDAGRYNPARAIVYQWDKMTYNVTIDAGTSDDVDVYHEGNTLYVLSRNYGLDYVGLELIENGEIVGEVFFQYAENADVNLDAAPWNIIKQLSEYIY